jgi:phage terminase large subunit
VNPLRNFNPHPAQLKVLNSTARWLVVLAGVRGGKTYSCAAAFLLRIFKDLAQGRFNDKVPATGDRYRRPRYHAWVCAPTYDLLKEPRRYITQLLPPELIENFYEGRELWLKGGVLIEFKSTDNAKALVSAGLNGMWLDEADRIDADAWRGQLSTRLSDKKGWCLFSSTPYAARAGFLWQDFISRKSDATLDIDFQTWRFIDNVYNDLGEWRAAKARTPARYFKREYEASLDAFVGLVYELGDSHVIDVAPDKRAYKSVVAGVDFGWNDPGAIVVVADTGKQLIVVDELKEPHLQVIAQNPGERCWVSEAVRLQQKWGISKFLCDHEPGFVHAFQRAGLSAMNAHKDIALGIRRVSETMLPNAAEGTPGSINYVAPSPGLVVSRHCKNLIEEMRSLAWNVDKHGNMLEEPAPGNDHLSDALRYAVVDLRRYTEPGTKVPPKRQAMMRG